MIFDMKKRDKKLFDAVKTKTRHTHFVDDDYGEIYAEIEIAKRERSENSLGEEEFDPDFDRFYEVNYFFEMSYIDEDGQERRGRWEWLDDDLDAMPRVTEPELRRVFEQVKWSRR